VLAAEITQALTHLGRPWECLWVNDASTDATADALAALHHREPRHRWLRLTRSFGQSAALAAGFRAARGVLLATLDGDGQNDPADIPLLLAVLERDHLDLVNGVRARRRDSWVRRVSSRLANGFRNGLTGERVSDVGCAIRVFRREPALRVPVFKGMHRFFPTLLRLQGCRIAERPVNHRPRERGQTKYGIHNRLWVGLVDTLAVCWMQRRLVFPEVAELSAVAPPSQP
jgi:dolichol-phosphate mannosyltransferase